MEFEDRLRDAWQVQTRSAMTLEKLDAAVARQRRRRAWHRALEVVLSLAAILVFGHALLSGAMAPAHWLLLPFFAVFLPTAWVMAMRAPRVRADDASEAASTYARLRMAQIRTSLRDLWMARRSALALAIYAWVTWLAVWIFADVSWRSAAATLLAYAMAWLVGTFWLSRRLGPRRLREYRALRRLIQDPRRRGMLPPPSDSPLRP